MGIFLGGLKLIEVGCSRLRWVEVGKCKKTYEKNMAYVDKKSKECHNHVKLCKLSNATLKRVRPSSRDVILDEPYKKGEKRPLKVSDL